MGRSLGALALAGLAACARDGSGTAGTGDTADPAGTSVAPPSTDSSPTTATDPTDPTDPTTDPPAGVEPPLGGTSGGDGGADAPAPVAVATPADHRLIAPRGSADGRAVPLLVVISGVEGADLMAQNLAGAGPVVGLGDAVVAVLDGRTARAADAAAVLDAVRAAYDIDNDRTWLLSESAGTGAGLTLAFEERPSWFAAYWANDVIARGAPARDADALGFRPWGNAAPGGDFADAEAIVDAMDAAGYRLPADAPYSGAGAGTHGSSPQFLAALAFFPDKSRR